MNRKMSFPEKIYRSPSTVFTIGELALLLRQTNGDRLKSQLNYYAKNEVLKNPRQGVYTKPEFDFWELAGKIYRPAYISLETVLVAEGIIFQYTETIFVASYLTRKIKVAGKNIQYRRIKEEILLNPRGIINKGTYAIATKERAFLDALYLYPNYYFDNIDKLDKKMTMELAEIYNSEKLSKRTKRWLR